MHRRGKGIGRNFSRGGLPAIFQIQEGGGGAQPRFSIASMVKMKEFSGQGGMALPCLCLPTPMLRGQSSMYDCASTYRSLARAWTL